VKFAPAYVCGHPRVVFFTPLILCARSGVFLPMQVPGSVLFFHKAAGRNSDSTSRQIVSVPCASANENQDATSGASARSRLLFRWHAIVINGLTV
jgi:hypothetical protein